MWLLPESECFITHVISFLFRRQKGAGNIPFNSRTHLLSVNIYWASTPMPSPQGVPVDKGSRDRERARGKEKGRRETRAIFQEPTARKQEEFMATQVQSAETEGCTRTEHTQRLANPPRSIRNGFPGRWHRSFIWKDNWWGKAIEGRFSWLNRLKFQRATSGLNCFHGVQANGKRVSIGWTPGPWVLQCDFTEKEHTAGSISNFYIYLTVHDFFLPQALKDQKYKGENCQPDHQWPSMQLERLQSWGFFFF